MSVDTPPPARESLWGRPVRAVGWVLAAASVGAMVLFVVFIALVATVGLDDPERSPEQDYVYDLRGNGLFRDVDEEQLIAAGRAVCVELDAGRSPQQAVVVATVATSEWERRTMLRAATGRLCAEHFDAARPVIYPSPGGTPAG